MAANRRRFTRVPFGVEARVHVGKKTVTVDRIRDISLGGCFLPVSMDQLDLLVSGAVGGTCGIDIALTGATSELVVKMDAKIVRSGPEGVAVTFTKVTPDSLFHLQNIIRYNATDADEVDEEFRDHWTTERISS